VKAVPDGYTLLFVTSINAANAALYDNLNFNFIRDIAPVASIDRFPFVMEVNPSVPAKTVSEFIAYARVNQGKINMASVGNGSIPHLSGELFKMMTGVNMVHVPYRGDAPAVRCRSTSARCPARSSPLGLANYARWQLRPQRARRLYRTFQP
jgi:tripartite-type tricarboxylate transporter receptor subunit TctC